MMNPPGDDPDDLVQKKLDLNHIAKMSYQMHVPDSITMGPSRSTASRLYQDTDRLPVRMEVPDQIRLGGNDSMVMINGTDVLINQDPSHFTNLVPADASLPSTLYASNIEPNSDDEYTNIGDVRQQASNRSLPMATSSFNDPVLLNSDKELLSRVQLLQSRLQLIEQRVAQRDARDRWVYPCFIGYVLLQILLSLRRSMLN